MPMKINHRDQMHFSNEITISNNMKMRNHTQSQPFRLLNGRARLLEEDFSQGPFSNKGTPKASNRALNVWSKHSTHEHPRHPDSSSHWIDPRSFYKRKTTLQFQNLSDFPKETEIKQGTRALQRSVRRQKVIPQVSSNPELPRRSRANTTGKIQSVSRTPHSKRQSTLVLNQQMIKARHERSRSDAVIEQLTGYLNSKTKARKSPEQERLLDLNHYYINEEPHLQCECNVIGIQYQSTLMINKKTWGNLFIGCVRAASNFYYIKKYRISAVLAIGKNFPHKFTFVAGGYLHVKQDGFEEFNKAEAFMTHQLKHGTLLVTCYSANNRSCAFIAAYLIKTFGCSLQSALNLLMNARPGMNISPEVLDTLRKFEARYTGKV